MNKQALIYDAIRTPRGKAKNGSLTTIKPVDLLVDLINEISHRFPQISKTNIEDLILGVATPVGDQGADIARTAVLKSTLPESVPGLQLNRFCASGLEAINLAAQKVISGWGNLILAGGVESMSRVPMGSDGGAIYLDPLTNYDSYFVPQGISADLIATLEGFSREDLDKFALESQKRAAQSWDKGYFSRSIVPVKDMNGIVVLNNDDFRRPNTTLEKLQELKPAFELMGKFGGFDAVALQKFYDLETINHLHTGGNSSGIVDGAALTLIGSAEIGTQLGIVPRARIITSAVVGTDPTLMLTGPAPAAKLALERANLKPENIDVWEVNEAFAAVVLKFLKDMHLDPSQVNTNGGAIALGHPLGATGAILIGTALDELERINGRYALITLCIAGGMGIATIIERI